MKIIVRVLALLFATLDACALADDAVGVMRVDVACTLQATQLSDAVYAKVKEMRDGVLCGGWTGNLLSAIGKGYKCFQWQEALYTVLQGEMNKFEHSCFKVFGVGSRYPRQVFLYVQ